MIRYRNLLTAAMVFFVAGSAFAEVSWDAVQKKATSAKSYEVNYDFTGSKGTFKFNYRCVMPNKIRAEILESSDASKVGTILVWDGKDKVTAKVGGGVVIRKTSHKDVVGTAFYQPLLQLVIDQVKGQGTPTKTVDGNKTKFSFKTGNGTYNVWALDNGDIAKTERNDGHDRETRELKTIKYDGNPNCDF